MRKTKVKTRIIDQVRIFVGPALSLILILISFRLLLQPKIDEIREVLSSVNTNEARLTRLTEKIAFLESLDETKLRERSELVMRALPEKKRPLIIMDVLGQIAQETGVLIEKLGVQPGKIKSVPSKGGASQPPNLAYSLDIIGTFDQVEAFIKQIEEGLPAIRLERLSLSVDGSTQQYKASTDVFAYYYSLPKSLGKIDAALATISGEEVALYDRLRGFRDRLNSTTVPRGQVGAPPPLIESGRINPFI